MEFKKLIPGAALALLMTACSADEPGIDTPNTPTFEGDGYVAVSINLPTQAGAMSRALNDNFDDGDALEYSITNGMLVVFAGADEGTAVFKGAYDLGNIEKDDINNNENVTTRFTKTVKIDDIKVDGDNHLYGLIMLNYPNVVKLENGGISINGKDFGQQNFTALVNLTSSAAFYEMINGKAYNFFMTNSPLVDAKGGQNSKPEGNLATLVLMDNKVFKTAELAEADEDRTEFFVERAVAKATLKANVEALNQGFAFGTIDDIQWVVNNAEPTSYIVRNMGQYHPTKYFDSNNYLLYTSSNLPAILGPENYRFVGEKPMYADPYKPNVFLYRPYWCIDPNYSDAIFADNAEAVTDEDGATVGYNKPYTGDVKDEDFKANGHIFYPYENTFDVKHQNYRNTTRAVIKVTRKASSGNAEDDATFYTLAKDKEGKEIFNGNYEIDGKTLTALEAAKSHGEKAIAEYAPLAETIKAALGANASADVIDCLTFTWSNRDENGQYKIKTVVVTVNGNVIDMNLDAVIERVNIDYAVNEFKGGDMYYEVRFMHFASPKGSENTDLAPWTAPDFTTLTTEDSYPGLSAENYLGRYGMVRNNWYELELTGINHLGSPVVPNAHVDTPDDNHEEERWISFRVNVLSWAKRTQNIEF